MVRFLLSKFLLQSFSETPSHFRMLVLTSNVPLMSQPCLNTGFSKKVKPGNLRTMMTSAG